MPRFVRRYAGRRIPVEKYVCEKVDKYNTEGMLVAPGYVSMQFCLRDVPECKYGESSYNLF